MIRGSAGHDEPAGFGPAVWVAAIAVLAAASAAIFFLFPRLGAAPSKDLALESPTAQLAFPPFVLENSKGEQVTDRDLRGQPCVVEFFFTSCALCAVMNQGYQRLQKDLPPEVRLVSITVDPDHDTGEVLEAYAQRHDADPKRWMFLRGDMMEVCDLMEHGFGYMRAASPAMHSLRFALMDGEGRLVKSYAPIEFGEGDEKSLSETELNALVHDAKELLKSR